jgi:thiol-disulfide isomerase/thioredoxin
VTKPHDWTKILPNQAKGLKHMIKKSWVIAGLLVFLSGLASAAAIKSGQWRFEMTTAHTKIPFIVELNQNGKQLTGKLLNGKEIIPLKGLKLSGNNISIPLQDYENSLEMRIEGPTSLSGNFVRHNKNPKVMLPVQAQFNQERFPGDKNPPEGDFSGKWEVTLNDGPESSSPGIVVFEQKGNDLHGTIMTPTGDYRFFQGYVSGNSFEVASFDGVYNYHFQGKVDKKKLKGEIKSTTLTEVTGNYNPKAELPDAYAQTQLQSINFTFPDLTGKQISLQNPKFKDKPVIVTFFGSWCPNCIDEMNYLIPWYNQNAKRGVEVVALAFERSLTEEDAKRQLKKVHHKNNIPFTLLVAGTSGNDKPADKIKGLKNFISFPTTIFLNKKHEVVKVHAGFNGPSTGEYFVQWQNEFNQTVNKLLE